MLGFGVLKGMSVTLWNAILTYVNPAKGITTFQYPEEKRAMPERYRNFPFLIFDETASDPRCVACDICAKECPPKCIYIIPEKDPNGKVIKKPAQFDIDYAICMNCGICEEVCPFDAIYMDHEFELAEYDRLSDLMYDKEKLLKPKSHFEKIRPLDFAAVEDKRATKGVKGKAAPAPAATATPAAESATAVMPKKDEEKPS